MLVDMEGFNDQASIRYIILHRTEYCRISIPDLNMELGLSKPLGSPRTSNAVSAMRS